jgi:hypothetical protein
MPNDSKLSDGGAVRCSAWLGDLRLAFELAKSISAGCQEQLDIRRVAVIHGERILEVLETGVLVDVPRKLRLERLMYSRDRCWPETNASSMAARV